jgi:hypothetical protein
MPSPTNQIILITLHFNSLRDVFDVWKSWWSKRHLGVPLGRKELLLLAIKV